MMNDPLSRFEDHIQRLVEGGFARLFAGRLHPREVAVQLARAMEDRSEDRSDGRYAPDIYLIRLNPADHEAILNADNQLPETLAEEALEMARAARLKMNDIPQVKVLADQDVSPHQVVVNAQHSAAQTPSTQGMPIQSVRQALDAPKAVLIVNGNHHIPLKNPIINIGRHRDNHVILDDPGVSRHHAQIRLRFGQYLIFDLDSSMGTKVNDQRIQEAILTSGDVIRLADTNLIYVEERGDESADPEDYTRPYVPD